MPSETQSADDTNDNSCSKVPNIRDVGLMEDLATLRVSSQHISDRLHHKVFNGEQIRDSLQRIASVVGQQKLAKKAIKPWDQHLRKASLFKRPIH